VSLSNANLYGATLSYLHSLWYIVVKMSVWTLFFVLSVLSECQLLQTENKTLYLFKAVADKRCLLFNIYSLYHASALCAHLNHRLDTELQFYRDAIFS